MCLPGGGLLDRVSAAHLILNTYQHQHHSNRTRYPNRGPVILSCHPHPPQLLISPLLLLHFRPLIGQSYDFHFYFTVSRLSILPRNTILYYCFRRLHLENWRLRQKKYFCKLFCICICKKLISLFPISSIFKTPLETAATSRGRNV